jgi:hypothetical protein
VNGSVLETASDFTPIPSLSRTDGDVVLIFLVGNGVSFEQRSDDDWYRAIIPDGHEVYSSVNGTAILEYRPAEAASAMGCVEQYQFCNAALPEESRCGPLTGFYDAAMDAGPLFGLTRDQVVGYKTIVPERAGSQYLWFVNTLLSSSIFSTEVLSALGAKALASQYTLSFGLQGAISPSQWKLDVIHWWSATLASLQAGIVGAAAGPPSNADDGSLLLPQNSYQRNMCDNQVGEPLPYG